MLGKIEIRRRRGQQRTRLLEGFIDSRDFSLSKLCKIVKYREAWHVAGSTWGQRVRHDLGTEQQHEE